MAGLLVHEWIEQTGGAEKVLDSMAREYEDAEIACLWDDAPDRYPGRTIHQSWMSKTQLRNSKIAGLPFMSSTWRGFRVDKKFDWILASSYVFAHHARFEFNGSMPPKYVYAHTPARYFWAPEYDPRGNSPLVRAAAPYFRSNDRRRAKEITAVAANSKFVLERVRQSWGIDGEVIYPPVDVRKISSVEDWSAVLDDRERRILDELPREFLLGASRFVEYKGLRDVIDVGVTTGLPVVIAGRGPQEMSLRNLAGESGADVTFVISPSDSLLYALYQRASLFVFPPIEDFGIMPVEAMAAGCPVIVSSIGGTSETVQDGISGYKLDSFRGEGVKESVDLAMQLQRGAVAASVAQFDSAQFGPRLRSWMGTEA